MIHYEIRGWHSSGNKNIYQTQRGKNPLLPRIYGLKFISFRFFISTWLVLDIWNVIMDLNFISIYYKTVSASALALTSKHRVNIPSRFSENLACGFPHCSSVFKLSCCWLLHPWGNRANWSAHTYYHPPREEEKSASAPWKKRGNSQRLPQSYRLITLISRAYEDVLKCQLEQLFETYSCPFSFPLTQFHHSLRKMKNDERSFFGVFFLKKYCMSACIKVVPGRKEEPVCTYQPSFLPLLIVSQFLTFAFN